MLGSYFLRISNNKIITCYFLCYHVKNCFNGCNLTPLDFDRFQFLFVFINESLH